MSAGIPLELVGDTNTIRHRLDNADVRLVNVAAAAGATLARGGELGDYFRDALVEWGCLSNDLLAEVCRRNRAALLAREPTPR